KRRRSTTSPRPRCTRPARPRRSKNATHAPAKCVTASPTSRKHSATSAINRNTTCAADCASTGRGWRNPDAVILSRRSTTKDLKMRTLLPTGHPRDEGAADRMLQAIRSAGQHVDDRPQLSVVVPAYKESGNLDLVCDRLLGVFDRDDVSAEILLIDDSSPDDTYEVAVRQMWKSPRIRAFTKPTPRGMGNAIQYGIDRARAPIVGITMGDGSDQVERLPEMYRKVANEGYGLAIGWRYR